MDLNWASWLVEAGGRISLMASAIGGGQEEGEENPDLLE